MVHSSALIIPYVESTETYVSTIIKDYKAEYYKRLVELKRQYEVRLQAFETKKLEAMQKYRESWTLDEVLETSHECITSGELS
jgi:hypothetical protein